MKNERVYIVRCGEVALKGMNKPYFERVLTERIKKRLKIKGMQEADVKRNQGLIYVRTDDSIEEKDIVREISKVFGVASISPAVEAEKDIDIIGEEAVKYMNRLIEEKGIKTFKVKAKRADKSYPIKSPDIARITGANILKGCKVLKVDVHNPDIVLFVDVRDKHSYIYQEKVKGFGGLPLGTNGKGLVLFSGGIDSPVAAWMMAKRGMQVEALHFHSYPYTSLQGQKKVEDLIAIVGSYAGNIRMHAVNILPIQKEIVSNCPEKETTILVRRFMMRIAEKIAKKSDCMMLITGENLGQVASQTAESLTVTDNATDIPIMRPLIALDKTDIMDLAEEIGTFKTSIIPFEDSCTVFLPEHPITKPKLANIEKSESVLDIEKLVDEAVAAEEIIDISPDFT